MTVSIACQIEVGGAVVVSVRGEVEGRGAYAIRTAVNEALSRHRPSLLYLDLGLVTFISSEGIGALLASRIAAEGRGTRLVLRDPSPFVRRLMDTHGVQSLLS